MRKINAPRTVAFPWATTSRCRFHCPRCTVQHYKIILLPKKKVLNNKTDLFAGYTETIKSLTVYNDVHSRFNKATVYLITTVPITRLIGEIIIRRQAQYSVDFSYYSSAHQNLNARLITTKAIPT